MARGLRTYGVGIKLGDGRWLTDEDPLYLKAASSVGARRKVVDLASFFWFEVSKYDEADFVLLVTKKKGVEPVLVARTVRGPRFKKTNETDFRIIQPQRKPKPKVMFVAAVSTTSGSPQPLHIEASSYTEARFEVIKEAEDLHERLPKVAMRFFLRNQTLPLGSPLSAVAALLLQSAPKGKTKENIVNVDPSKTGRNVFHYPGRFRPEWVMPTRVQRLKDQLSGVVAAVTK